MPKDDAHNGHTLTESSGLGHRLHPAVIRKINDLVALNITDTRHVTRLLRNFVEEELLAKCGMHPSRLDRTFYPSPADIRYHVYAAKVRQQLSKLDQEEMTRRSEQWAQEHPSSNYFFRPFIPADDTESSSNKGLIDGNNTEGKLVF